MTGVFRLSKLARRLAIMGFWSLGFAALAAACGTDALPTGVTSAPDSVAGPEADSADANVGPIVVAFRVEPPFDTLQRGDTLRLAVVATDSAGNPLTGIPIRWTSEHDTIAEVSADGLVRALAAGVSAVVAATDGHADTARLTVLARDTAAGDTTRSDTTTSDTTSSDTTSSDTTSAAPRAGYHVTPGGSGAGTGSADDPWDLATAIGSGSPAGPGDTIWVHEGTYRGAFRSYLSGTSGQPVVLRAYPGERAVIDGGGQGTSSTFIVKGDWTILWGLEFTNSDPDRTVDRPNTVVNDASHTKYLNLVVHDGSVGFYSYTDQSDVEVYGSIFYNNGWQGSDRGHGHALYVKSNTGPVVLRENVLFNQFGYGVHAYTNEGSGQLNGIRVERNVAFNNGTQATNSTSGNILLGGHDTADDDVVIGNIALFSPGAGGRNVRVGYGTLLNGDVTVENNYIVGGSPVLDLGAWTTATVAGNVLAGTGRMVDMQSATVAGWVTSGNRHHRDPLSSAWRLLGVSHPWLGWQAATGLWNQDEAGAGTPSAPAVTVLPNAFEPGRAVVVVYNWSGQGAVSVDLSAVLNAGDQFTMHNVQDLFGDPVASGTYGGGVSLPTSGVAPPVPVGMGSSNAPRTGPVFDVFLVRTP